MEGGRALESTEVMRADALKLMSIKREKRGCAYCLIGVGSRCHADACRPTVGGGYGRTIEDGRGGRNNPPRYNNGSCAKIVPASVIRREGTPGARFDCRMLHGAWYVLVRKLQYSVLREADCFAMGPCSYGT